MEKLETAAIKSKIFYLSDVFKTVNVLNLELQGKRSDLVTCAQKMKGYVGKLKYWKKEFEKKNLLAFENFKKTDSTSKCIAACIVHLEGLHTEFERRFMDLLKMDYPLWFVELENYEPGDESTESAKMLFCICICSYLSSIHEKANCIAIFWTGRPHPLGICHF